MKKCIDVSNHQGVVSTTRWKGMKDEVPCTIIRCSFTYWRDKFTMDQDEAFTKSIQNAIGAGMAIGIYHYSQAKTVSEAQKEAELVLRLIAPYKKHINLPVAFDFEFGGRLTASYAKSKGKAYMGKICDTFLKIIEMAGYDTMVYANLSTLNAYLDSSLYKRWKIWVAQYNSKCDYKHPIYMWQYTSGYRMAGLGKVDMSYLYGEAKPQPKKQEAYKGTMPKIPKRGWFTSGDSGLEVRRLQIWLNWYFGYSRLTVDGKVGRLTVDAVRDYQGREKLKVDGLWGSQCQKHAKLIRR